MQSFLLFEDDECDTRREDGGQRDQSGHESRKAVGEDEAYDGYSNRARRTVNESEQKDHQ